MKSQKTIKPEIMIVGNIKEAFWDCSELNNLNIFQCDIFSDAIREASIGKYSKIFVVMSSFNGSLGSLLESLKQVNTQSKLILLSQMYEEPLAMQLLKSFQCPDNPADEYHICPVSAKSLLPARIFSVPVKADKTETATPELIPDPVEKEKAGNSVVSIVQDVRIRELERLATEDDLTSLKNRRYIWEFLRQILFRAKSEGFNATLLVFDIDNFKHYNDAYGHAVGNNVLMQTATMMKRCWRQQDVVGRIGGDEFAVVFWDMPDKNDEKSNVSMEERRNKQQRQHPDKAMFIAERFRNEMNSTDLFLLGTDGKGTLTISGGLASFPGDGHTPDELFEKADMAMMEAKKSGKNRIYLVGSEDAK